MGCANTKTSVQMPNGNLKPKTKTNDAVELTISVTDRSDNEVNHNDANGTAINGIDQYLDDATVEEEIKGHLDDELKTITDNDEGIIEEENEEQNESTQNESPPDDSQQLPEEVKDTNEETDANQVNDSNEANDNSNEANDNSNKANDDSNAAPENNNDEVIINTDSDGIPVIAESEQETDRDNTIQESKTDDGTIVVAE